MPKRKAEQDLEDVKVHKHIKVIDLTNEDDDEKKQIEPDEKEKVAYEQYLLEKKIDFHFAELESYYNHEKYSSYQQEQRRISPPIREDEFDFDTTSEEWWTGAFVAFREFSKEYYDNAMFNTTNRDPVYYNVPLLEIFLSKAVPKIFPNFETKKIKADLENFRRRLLFPPDDDDEIDFNCQNDEPYDLECLIITYMMKQFPKK